MEKQEYKIQIEAFRQEIVQLKAQLQEAHTTIQALTIELEKYRKPPKNSNNSSIPPSQDLKRKPYPKREKSERSAGGQLGHEGRYHPLVDKPDEQIQLYPSTCSDCGSRYLLKQPDQIGERRQEVELPPIQPIIREYQQCAALCQNCAKLTWGEFPEAISAPVQIGPQATAVIGLLKVNHHQSHQNIVRLFADVLGLPISKGCINARLQGLAKTFQDEYEELRSALKKSWLVQSDETGNKVNGKKGYIWVFVAPLLCLFVSAFSRGFQVIKDTIGEEFEGTWVSDRYNAQLKMACEHQLCLAHLLRDCQYAIEAETSEWATSLKTLFKETIAFRKKQAENFDPLEINAFRQIQIFKQHLDVLFDKPPPQPIERKLFHSLLGRKKQLFQFLYDPFVPFDNNAAERALRSRVIHRKVTGGFRSIKGTQAHDILSSIIETAKFQQLNILDVLSRKTQLSMT